MHKTKHRTSFALDDTTIERLRRLARRWEVSQAEVVRRAVEIAEDQAERRGESVRERLQGYQERGRLTADAAEKYLSEVEEERQHWDRKR